MNWKKIEETVLFKGWRSVIQKTFKLPNGIQANFDILKADHYVTIVAFTKNHEAILVKQYRPGPEIPLISFPEGGIETNEQPERAAARELLEETGYQAERYIFLKAFHGAYTSQRQVCLLALNCEKVTTQNLDATEFIDVFLLPLKKFRTFLSDSNNEAFTNVDAAYLALDYLKLL